MSAYVEATTNEEGAPRSPTRTIRRPGEPEVWIMSPSDRLLRLRVRLKHHFGERSFVLLREPDGWRWDIPQQPMHTRRVFPTVQKAVEHADVYTNIWWPLVSQETASNTETLPATRFGRRNASMSTATRLRFPVRKTKDVSQLPRAA
jgi:hypothetical protein